MSLCMIIVIVYVSVGACKNVWGYMSASLYKYIYLYSYIRDCLLAHRKSWNFLHIEKSMIKILFLWWGYMSQQHPLSHSAPQTPDDACKVQNHMPLAPFLWPRPLTKDPVCRRLSAGATTATLRAWIHTLSNPWNIDALVKIGQSQNDSLHTRRRDTN